MQPCSGKRLDPLDVHIGQLIKQRRKAIGMPQTMLADHLGITFQQVQKYEKGANRVSAATLYRMARLMEVPATYFYDGMEETADPIHLDDGSPDAAARSEAFDLEAAVTGLPPKLRQALIQFVRTCSARCGQGASS